MPMAYWDAVKLYNYEGKFEEYCNPRKNSPEYYEVLKIMSSNKQPLPAKLNKKKKKKVMVSVGTQAGNNNTSKIVGRPIAPPSSDPKIQANRDRAQKARDAKKNKRNAGN